MNDAVLFHSNGFSLEPTPEGDKTYDLPLGDDLAAHLRARLLELQPGLWADEPLREDWGTILRVKDQGVECNINVQWLPDGEADDRWGICFTRPTGCLVALLGRRPAAAECQAVRQLVGRVLAGEPALFRDVQWLSQQEYDARL